ncbi:hypothetical protein H072_1438 [Dactylellina haptotyla CBS 200.50]|uniref:Uncharacterized protein n=1 Tax=Dactylellina haptotyla (strain CBS 200.50) TaxID=1284197 RepID=S8BYI1_DACHA|nr:hypothetical protein H072_1438 [Dactylellina haptotyla CBS 200.50]
MAYGGAAPSFDSYRPSQTPAMAASIDLDIREHFELPDQYLDSAISNDMSLSPSKYSLSIANPAVEIPAAVQSFVTSLRSTSFKHIIKSFRDLHRHGFIKYLTSSDFSRILVSANPRLLFPTSTMARQITPGTLPEGNPYLKLHKRFWSDINFVLEHMLLSGHHLTAMDYTNLMSKAMWTQRRKLQTSFWNRMIESGVQPTTWAYNTRLAMVAGTRPANSLRKFPLVHDEQYLAHWRSQEQNAVTEAMAIYADMLKHGLYPNSMTVELLILAHARIGDIPGITKIVQNVYGITVDGDNTNAQPIISEGSPVYPTPRTLKAIAVAYCRNAQFGAALQAVEHVSRIYGPQINEATWNILLTYSYAFARPKYGILPGDTTSRLVEAMKERTAGAEPNLQARDIIIRSLTRSTDLEELELAETEIRNSVSYFRTKIQHGYNLTRERWVSAPAENKAEVARLEKKMNDELYQVCMWKDAMGYWLYALLRGRWELMRVENSPLVEFETAQMNLLEEFGAYWHDYRPTFEPPKEAGEKVIVGERVPFRYKYPASMVGLKGFPAM